MAVTKNLNAFIFKVNINFDDAESGMTGLRARQKADRNRRILGAASALFRQSGYDAARIEDIAERAEVSVGTFYNYYENKGDLLLATVSMEVEEVLEAGRMRLANPPSDVAEALNGLIRGYYDHSLMYLTKEMWRTAMSLSILHPGTRFSRHYTELDGRLRDQVIALLRILQTCGATRANLDVMALGEFVFNNLNQMFMAFVMDEEMTLEELNHRVARQNAIIADLISSATGRVTDPTV